MNTNLFFRGFNLVLALGMLLSLVGISPTLAQTDAGLRQAITDIVSELPQAETGIPIADDQAVTTPEDSPITITLTAMDPDGDCLSWSIDTQPTNGSLDGTAPNLTYTPNTNYYGADSFTFTVSDGEHVSTPATVSITVTPVNDAPLSVDDTYETPMNTVLVVNTAIGVLANDSDPDSTALTALLINTVSHGVLSFRGDGYFVYKPTNGYIGLDQFTYRIFDGHDLSPIATVTIAVGLGNTPPVASADVYAMESGTTLTVDAADGVLKNDSDADEEDILTVKLIGGVAFGNLTLNPDGSFVYTPNPYYIGSDHFTYQAYDGEVTSVTAMVTINIKINDNHDPEAAADAYSAEMDMTLMVDAADGVLSNDSDPDGDELVAQLVESTISGSLSFQADGSFAYIPEAGYFGTDHFSYQAYDGLDTSEIVVVTIVVNAPNHIFLPAVLK